MLPEYKEYPTLVGRLSNMGWSQSDIEEEIIDAYAEIMDAFYNCEDDNYVEPINEIMRERFGFVVRVEELFEVFDNI